MELLALTAFAPMNARQAIATINTPEASADLRRVKRRPVAIKKLSVESAKQVIAVLDDPYDIVAVLGVSDKRVAVRKALDAHRLRPRADALMRRPHPTLEGRPLHDGLTELGALLSEFNTVTAAGVVAWVQRLRGPEKGLATREVYRQCALLGQDPRGYRMARLLGSLAPLALEVFLGREPGVTMTDLLMDLPGTENLFVGAALDQLHSLSGDEVTLLLTAKLPVPYETVGRLDDGAVGAAACWHAEVPHLLRHGYMHDPISIVDSCAGMSSIELRAVLAETKDTCVAEALLPRLEYKGVRKEMDALTMLNAFPNLSSESRQIILTNASMMDLRYFMNGRTLNIPRPGELRTFVNAIAMGVPTYTGMYAVIEAGHAGGMDFQSAPLQELAEAVVLVGSAELLLSQASRLGKLAVEQIVKVCGDDPSVWTNVAALAKEWDGTIRDLALAAHGLR